MPFFVLFVAFISLVIAPNTAEAEPCDELSFCARLPLQNDSEEGLFDPIGFDTGFVPSGSPFQIRAALNLGAASSASLYGDLIANSPPAVNLGLGAQPEGGLLEMDFGFEMGLQARIDALGIKETFSIPIPYIPQDLRFFAYQHFYPFLLGDEATPVTVTDDIERFDLISINIVDYIAPGVGFFVQGNIKIAASGRLSTNYRSVKISVDDVGDFVSDGQLLRLEPASSDGYGAGRDLHVQLVGDLTYNGRLLLFPAIEMKVVGIGVFDEALAEIPINLVNTGGELVFPKQTLRLGFPDIALSAIAVDFGEVAPGASTTRYLRIENRGEAELRWAFDDAGGSFAPLRPSGQLRGNASSTLTLVYTGAGLGPETGMLTLFTNDPDTPEISVAVFGSSLPPLGDGPDDDEDEEEEEESDEEDTDAGVPDPDAGDEEERVAYGGCSCDAGSPSSIPLAELGIVAAAFAFYRLRRKRFA